MLLIVFLVNHGLFFFIKILLMAANNVRKKIIFSSNLSSNRKVLLYDKSLIYLLIITRTFGNVDRIDKYSDRNVGQWSNPSIILQRTKPNNLT